MISLIFEKENKKLAISISKILGNKGFECSLDSIETIEKIEERIELAVLIFSKKSNFSEKIMQDYEVIFENDIPLIPFVVTDVELSVTMQHFLNSHDWINAFDITTNEAITDLTTLINEEINGTNASPLIAKKTSKITEKQSGNKKQTYAIIGVSSVFILVIIFLIFGGGGENNNSIFDGGNNNSLNNGSSVNDLIMGNWKLGNYQDNMPRSSQEYADFITNITALKQNFLLKINRDNTFEKLGFSQTEAGNWQIDPQNMILYMWPPDSKDHKDMLQIEKLTTDSLIMSIASQIDSTTQIITRFSLYRE